MKTIKVIDLLIKISRGEEVPKKIKYDNKIWYWNAQTKEYITTCTICEYRLIPKLGQINDEVEILEEEKKLPEKINVKGSYNSNKGYEDFNDNEKILVDKINSIIDYLESKEKGE